ncbi:MAG TPA: sulfatase [Solirubrobacterales bacterium]|nr:sulfatase [Solirubrobacterales bacterium]
MRVSARLAIAVGVLALLAALAIGGERSHASAEGKPRPSFVVIQTDDQTLDQLYASYTPPGGVPIVAMPNTLSLIADRGVTFNRYYVSYPLCCPSRVSLLTGRYAHNHNDRGNVPPEGGYPGFASRAAFSHNIAVWLQNAGYRTIHIGKFLNGYGDEPYDNGKTVPPGWSAWHTVLKADTDHYYYGYMLNNNGAIEGPYGDSGSWETREYGVRDDFGCPFAPTNGLPCYYETDKFNELATQELAATPPNQPFYMQVDYTAPHGDFRRPAGPEPAPRYYESFAGAHYPHSRSQGFDEGNVNDKPSFIREAPYLTPTEIHTYRVYYQKALESLRSVDDGVKQIVDQLGALHRLRNTYIIFTSDNGFFYGEHRLTGGKFLAYEPSTHLPFLMRGPGIKPGASTGELAANIDIAPTILELAQTKADKSIDGRSLYPFAHDPTLRTRRPILFESFVESNDVEENGGGPPATPAPEPTAPPTAVSARARGAKASIAAPPKNYYGIRLGPYKYIEWPNGEKELYDLNKDPYELNNRVKDPNLFPIRNFLHNQLLRLETCVGSVCREPTPPFPLTRDQRLRVQREKHKH